MTFQKNSEDIQQFERRSGSWENSLMQRMFFGHIHNLTLKAIPADFSPNVILDVGCGTGRLLRTAAKRWLQAHLLGVDPAEGMIAQARRLTPGADFQVSPVETLSITGGTVDLALTTVSFHHWQDQQRGIQRVASTLRPGGIFVLTDIVAPLWINRLRPHGRQADPAILREMFTKTGITVFFQRWALGHFLLVTAGRRNTR